ncbi:uncharacterized protein KY384_003981 [Bacidia gigantensis]|uniref:uncharacterized protein n=1 Tax=Bacidia gigantensis TaxID=2732470 RepID=UPI001D04E317|nr:uncharacterized protein KY384_003981 [Bacidia gigantensis]KAG8532340.1 hypothetical protein KY384_003981 [Bacidia gigantensis]
MDTQVTPRRLSSINMKMMQEVGVYVPMTHEIYKQWSRRVTNTGDIMYVNLPERLGEDKTDNQNDWVVFWIFVFRHLTKDWLQTARFSRTNNKLVTLKNTDDLPWSGDHKSLQKPSINTLMSEGVRSIWPLLRHEEQHTLAHYWASLLPSYPGDPIQRAAPQPSREQRGEWDWTGLYQPVRQEYDPSLVRSHMCCYSGRQPVDCRFDQTRRGATSYHTALLKAYSLEQLLSRAVNSVTNGTGQVSTNQSAKNTILALCPLTSAVILADHRRIVSSLPTCASNT